MNTSNQPKKDHAAEKTQNDAAKSEQAKTDKGSDRANSGENRNSKE